MRLALAPAQVDIKQAAFHEKRQSGLDVPQREVGEGVFLWRMPNKFWESWLVVPNLALIMLPLVVRFLPIGLSVWICHTGIPYVQFLFQS